jgi:glycosyltransferase involved in cell wall biosynthesis
MSCPLCTIPQREKVLYIDDLIYIVQSKDMKGHKVRLMSSIIRHTNKPTFEEDLRVKSKLIEYMNKFCGIKPWYFCDSTHCSIPEHYHFVACDAESTDQKEMILLADTKKVRFPLRQNILIGIPAHNEQDNIENIVKEAKKYGDVFVVSNGSIDHTAILATDAGAKVLDVEWSGYGRALQEIFKYAKYCNYDVLITLDGDGQHNPAEIPNFIDEINSSDIIVGNRFTTENNIPFHRRVVIQGINKIYSIGDTQCGFRAYNRNAINKIKINTEGMGASLEIINHAKELNLKIVDIPCKVTYNKPEVPTKFIYQGLTLVEIIFWGAVWDRPYTFLGIPTAILFIISLFSGLYTTGLYLSTFKLNISMTLICGLTFISFLVLGNITFIISMQRRLVKELSVK